MRTYDPKHTYFTSDTHFGHLWTITSGLRKFKDTEEMDFRLMANWSHTVRARDDIFHLGDFAFLGERELKRLLDTLPGRIHLILGNHDLHNPYILRNRRFCSIQMQEIIDIAGYKVILNHYPFRCLPLDGRHIQLYGHLHSKRVNGMGTLPVKERSIHSLQMDVGVDAHNYTPISFEQVLKQMKLPPLRK